MEVSSMFDYRVEKRLFRVEIGELKEDSDYPESCKREIDQESLHPDYKTKFSRESSYLPKEAKSKLSNQIEKSQ